MRSTRASAAIDRLKKRSGNDHYSMAMTSNGLFSLVLSNEAEKAGDENVASSSKPSRLCEPMPMDDFVVFVNAYGPQIPKRVSKLDVAFNEQLTKSRSKK